MRRLWKVALLPTLLLAAWWGAGGAWAQAEAGARVYAGDRVLLRIWNEPEMSDTFSVAESGRVILPRLGSVEVEGREIRALQDSLRVAYAEFLRNPSVEVRVLRRMAVTGEVRQPGLYWADLTMALPDLIARAGGFTEAGDPNRITLVRGEERIRFGRGNQDRLMVAELRSGDQIVVGQRNYFARNPIAAAGSVLSLVGFFITVILPGLR